jgi:teichuronic acid biosynthesis glycosyltransferase TuaG
MWVAEAVQSVLKQTHKALELIVIDDGSNDDTVDIVKRFADDPRLIVIARTDCSGGPATPRNDGIKIAKGQYLAFIDSDDIWHPRKLELQLKAMQAHGLNFLSSLHTSFRTEIPQPQVFNHGSLPIERKNHHQLICKNWVITSSTLVSNTLFKGIRFDQSTRCIGVEDYLVWLYMHQRTDIKSAVLIAPLVFYRLRRDSISSTKRIMAGKIFYLLGQYRYLGKSIGIRRYEYFIRYALSSLLGRLARK